MYHRRYRLIEPRGGELPSSSSSFLGEGAYGVVFKAMDLLQGNKLVALKKIKAESDAGGISSSALREITLLMQLDHPNIVKLENVLIERERISLIFELVDTDLKKYMYSSKQDLPIELVQSYTVQLLEALAYCHSMGVMHRDVKPENILVTTDGQLKLCDFGLARSFTPNNRPLTHEVVTKWYRAPEILLGSNVYDCSIDVWSVGCVLAEMSKKRPLFPESTDIQQIHLIFSILGTPTTAVWPGLRKLPHWRNNYPSWQPQSLQRLLPRLPPSGIHLLQKLLVFDPCSRASAVEALHHPFCEPYRSDFSMDAFFPFEGIQRLAAGSPAGSSHTSPHTIPKLPPSHSQAQSQATEEDSSQSRLQSRCSSVATIESSVSLLGSKTHPHHHNEVSKVTPEPPDESSSDVFLSIAAPPSLQPSFHETKAALASLSLQPHRPPQKLPSSSTSSSSSCLLSLGPQSALTQPTSSSAFTRSAAFFPSSTLTHAAVAEYTNSSSSSSSSNLCQKAGGDESSSGLNRFEEICVRNNPAFFSAPLPANHAARLPSSQQHQCPSSSVAGSHGKDHQPLREICPRRLSMLDVVDVDMISQSSNNNNNTGSGDQSDDNALRRGEKRERNDGMDLFEPNPARRARHADQSENLPEYSQGTENCKGDKQSEQVHGAASAGRATEGLNLATEEKQKQRKSRSTRTAESIQPFEKRKTRSSSKI